MQEATLVRLVAAVRERLADVSDNLADWLSERVAAPGGRLPARRRAKEQRQARSTVGPAAKAAAPDPRSTRSCNRLRH